MERVKKGEKYWIILIWGSHIYVDEVIDLHCKCDDDNYNQGNYFNTKEQAEAMASKLRAVLKGADVIEPMLDEDKFATEVMFNGDCKIIPPKNYLIGNIVSTDRGMIVEFIKK